jgi:hypothetical protein
MILYLAGLHGLVGSGVLEHIHDLGYTYNTLESYYYLKDSKKGIQEIIEGIKAEKVFLDSGAFSAFNKGIEIPVAEYSAFVAEHQHLFDVVASMDVKGDPEKSWENQKIMESFGLNPIPVYHVGEDLKWLYKYLDNYEYFGIGTAVSPIHSDRLRREFEQVFQADPEHKYHGFGMTDTRWLQIFPWHTVDSLSWCMTGAYGSIKFWNAAKAKTLQAVVTLIEKPRKKYEPRHFLNWGSKREQEEFQTRIAKFGLTLDELSKESRARNIVNIIFYLDFTSWINTKGVKFVNSEESFFKGDA